MASQTTEKYYGGLTNNLKFPAKFKQLRNFRNSKSHGIQDIIIYNPDTLIFTKT